MVVPIIGGVDMNTYRKRLSLAVGIAVVLVVLNFIFVGTGIADDYYNWLTEWLSPLLR
jgi:hypothetical protein